MKQIAVTIAAIILLMASGCNQSTGDSSSIPAKTLFSTMPASVTGIDFTNQIQYTEEYNPYTFRNFFNGGGVGLGDINKDGLVDVFFCANFESNRLYLNKGNFQFEDITSKAGLSTKNVWSSGVAMADVNGDGWLDIYVCKSGKPGGNRRYNELFINNGDLTFTEKAAEYGLADIGLSSHAAFFDYDHDGDLDCYLLNNSMKSVGGYDLVKGQRNVRDKKGGNKLYRNDNNKFVDVSAEAGIYGSSIGFGLGVTIGDVNRDGWPDIYVSNDFFERDYLYLNQKNGTFHEELESWIQELSFSSMGADMADVNNDGHPEIFVTDMLPETEARMKTKTNFEDWNKYQRNVLNGYHRQFTRNVFQRNNGDGTFSEIGRMAGVFATDWSWGALMTDLDNDGQKDIFVANGLLRDLTDQDYINFYSDPANVQGLMQKKKGVITKMVDAMPSEPVPNYAFANQGNFSFQNKAVEWGLGEPSFSNGSAYGDLDNDGDLDLVVNNINQPASIFRNNAQAQRKQKANFLNLELQGEGKNPFAVGAQVSIRHQGQTLFQELFPMRGFQSSVDYRLNFGLGTWASVDTLIIAWPNGRYTLQTKVKTNQRLQFKQADAKLDESPLVEPSYKPFISKVADALSFKHQENEFSDFDRDRLIYQMMSYEGPRMAKGDVNGDGLEDLFIGGAKDQAGAVFVQQAGGKFRRSAQPALEADKICEDMDAIFFDADGDRDQDLYVCSGGYEFPNSSSSLIDRLYFNDGRGNFTKSNQILPTFQFESTSCVDVADVDADGDLDLFVGVRLRPFEYGAPVNGYVLRNDGRGNFTDATAQIAPQLMNSGLYTDGRWVDIDGDRDPDLVVSGTWMPVRVFQNNRGQLKEMTNELGLAQSNGFWTCIEPADVDGDGDLDLLLGNLGSNTRLKADAKHPLNMYVNDFDGNGAVEQFITIFEGEKAYPFALLPDMVKQIPSLRKKYLKHAQYQGQTITDIFPPEALSNAIKWEVYTTQTSVAINDGKGKFSLLPLPVDAQISSTYGLMADDLDRDGIVDLLLAGNFFQAKPELGINAGSYGLVLKGLGKGKFSPLNSKQSGLLLKGAVRDVELVKSGQRKILIVAKNDDWVETFVY